MGLSSKEETWEGKRGVVLFARGGLLFARTRLVHLPAVYRGVSLLREQDGPARRRAGGVNSSIGQITPSDARCARLSQQLTRPCVRIVVEIGDAFRHDISVAQPIEQYLSLPQPVLDPRIVQPLGLWRLPRLSGWSAQEAVHHVAHLQRRRANNVSRGEWSEVHDTGAYTPWSEDGSRARRLSLRGRLQERAIARGVRSREAVAVAAVRT